MPFTNGHQLATGRPKGSKNKLTQAKDNIISYASKMLKSKDFMERVPPADFIRFIASITPKDLKVHLPNLRYVNRIPEATQEFIPVDTTNTVNTVVKPIDTTKKDSNADKD